MRKMKGIDEQQEINLVFTSFLRWKQTNKQTNGDAQSGQVFEINWKFIIIKIIIIIKK